MEKQGLITQNDSKRENNDDAPIHLYTFLDNNETTL